MNNKKETFRMILLEILDKYNLTQRRLAKLVGRSNGTISDYISGKTIPQIDMIWILHQKFNLSYDYLLDGRAVGESELLEKWRKLSNKQQAALLELIKAMI